jgi:hypothetical protein
MLVDLQGNYLSSSVVGSNVSFDKLKECYRLTEEIIDSLDTASLNQMLGGSGGDLDTLLGNIVNETYSCIYGQEQKTFNSSSIFYLEKLSENVEETLRIKNLTYFITSVLPDFDLNWHHLEWCDIMMSKQYHCVLAARGHGKSYMCSNAYPVWRMYGYDRTSQNKQLNQLCREGNIFSNTTRQANRLLEVLKETIKETPVLNERLYPGGDGWAGTKIDAKNGSKIRVYGVGNSVRGGHPGWIMCDDLLDESALYSQEQREKAITYFHGVIMNMIEPGGFVGLWGTPFHTSDVYGDIKKKKGWHYREYPCIFPSGQVLWENRFSFKDLMLKRDSQGSITFSRENLCRPITNDSSIFPYHILERSIIGMDKYTMVRNAMSFPVKFVRKATGCDFAISSSIGADSSVFIVGGIDEAGVIWILNIYRLTGKSFAEQLSALKSIHQNFQPDLLVLETNGFQKIFYDESLKQNMPVIDHKTTTNKYDLKEGIPALSVLFETGKFRVPTGDEYSRAMKDLMFTELSSFGYTDKGLQGTGAHDDIVIALWKLVVGLKYKMTGFDFAFA